MSNDKRIDLSDIDVSKITSLNNMLPLALKKVNYYDKIDYIDVWGWDVKNIEDMSNTFAYKLVNKIDGSDSWNVSNVNNIFMNVITSILIYQNGMLVK